MKILLEVEMTLAQRDLAEVSKFFHTLKTIQYPDKLFYAAGMLCLEDISLRSLFLWSLFLLHLS